MLSVEDVPDNRPEWELHLYCPLDQLKGYVGLGAKGGIPLAALEVVGRGVRFDLQWIVKPLLSVQARDRNHPIICLSYASQVLLAHVGGCITVLAVAGFVYDQSPGFNRSRLGLFEHQLHPAAVHRLRIPAGLRKKPLEALGLLTLCSHNRLGVGQGRKRLVALIAEQKTFHITAEALALGAVSKKIVEPSGVIFQRTGSGLYGLSLGHGGTPPTGTIIRAPAPACCNKLPVRSSYPRSCIGELCSEGAGTRAKRSEPRSTTDQRWPTKFLKKEHFLTICQSENDLHAKKPGEVSYL